MRAQNLIKFAKNAAASLKQMPKEKKTAIYGGLSVLALGSIYYLQQRKDRFGNDFYLKETTAQSSENLNGVAIRYKNGMKEEVRNLKFGDDYSFSIADNKNSKATHEYTVKNGIVYNKDGKIVSELELSGSTAHQLLGMSNFEVYQDNGSWKQLTDYEFTEGDFAKAKYDSNEGQLGKETKKVIGSDYNNGAVDKATCSDGIFRTSFITPSVSSTVSIWLDK